MAQQQQQLQLQLQQQQGVFFPGDIENQNPAVQAKWNGAVGNGGAQARLAYDPAYYSDPNQPAAGAPVVSDETPDDLLRDIIRDLAQPGDPTTPPLKRAALNRLLEFVRVSCAADAQFGQVLAAQAKFVLIALLQTMQEKEAKVQVAAMLVLRELLKLQSALFQDMQELLVTKLMDLFREVTASSKEVLKTAEVLLQQLALQVLNVASALKLLVPHAKQGEYPLDQTALKLIAKLVEAGRVSGAEQLSEMMPAVLVAYHSMQGATRKAAVLVLVALHRKMGVDALRPHLASLAANKQKLLEVYIKKGEAEAPAAEPALGPRANSEENLRFYLDGR